MRRILRLGLRTLDLVGLPITFLAAFWMKNVRRALHRLPLTRGLLGSIGIFPVLHHYYEPLVLENDIRFPLSDERKIPGLDMNILGQLELLGEFKYNDELNALPLEDPGKRSYYYHNQFFESGDAEFLFNMVRHFKPANIIEIGSGFSTLMARSAIERNTADDPAYACNMVCIEPNEQPWMEREGIKTIRQNVESLDLETFDILAGNDILFIDSSHVIRPQGDVLFEYLELLGSLNKGVFVHVHDIFTPRDYPERWVIQETKLWNEQYLLEAFLSYNQGFTIIGSLNHLWHHYRDEIARACPVLAREPHREPGSFWFVRN